MARVNVALSIENVPNETIRMVLRFSQCTSCSDPRLIVSYGWHCINQYRCLVLGTPILSDFLGVQHFEDIVRIHDP